MIRAGLIQAHEATGPEGHTFTVLTTTARGKDAAQRVAVDVGHVPEQQTWTGLVKPTELSHDTAVYRAALDERARIEAEGGERAAHEAKLAAAHDLGLYVVNEDHVSYPDAQLDIEDADGVSGRVNVEIISDHYHAAADPRSPAATDRWSCRDATHRCRRRVDRDDPGAHGADRRPARRVPRPAHPRPRHREGVGPHRPRAESGSRGTVDPVLSS